MLTSRAMGERIKTGLCIDDESNFISKSPKFLNSTKKLKSPIKGININDLDYDLRDSERESQTARGNPQTTKHFTQKITFEDRVEVDNILRKNLGKLK